MKEGGAARRRVARRGGRRTGLISLAGALGPAGPGQRRRRNDMTWTWQLEKQDGTVLTSRGLPKESFGSQGDAESWIGENWRSLLEAGVDQVTLLDDGSPEYGPMSLHPAG